MKNLYDVSVSVTSEITPVDQNGLALDGETVEKTTTKARASMESDGFSTRLSYTEEHEDQKVKTDIKIEGDTITVARQGSLESTFVFREGESHSSLYKIPPYSFDAEIKTTKIRNGITENGGILSIFYYMSVGGDYRKVKMKIEVNIP